MLSVVGISSCWNIVKYKLPSRNINSVCMVQVKIMTFHCLVKCMYGKEWSFCNRSNNKLKHPGKDGQWVCQSLQRDLCCVIFFWVNLIQVIICIYYLPNQLRHLHIMHLYALLLSPVPMPIRMGTYQCKWLIDLRKIWFILGSLLFHSLYTF